jgi:serine O-acetyltransferase
MNPEFLDKIYRAHQSPKTLPGVEEIEHFIHALLQFLFPELNNKRLASKMEVDTHARLLCLSFQKLLHRTEACRPHDQGLCQQFFDRLETVYDLCLEDSQAILLGDPAAVDNREVTRTYPGFFAIAVYRIAHLMHELQIPYLPRIFTEYAHSKTGIDIHPGAQIGRRFCIDHGTGVVIGETTRIGNDVKIYQGVTLGALSVRKDMAQQQRHPTIDDGVVIYAGATILGGQTVIGHHSIIGGGVWITSSVPPHTTVYYNAKGNQISKELLS